MFTFLDSPLLSGLGTSKMHFNVHLGRVKIVEHAGNPTFPNLPFKSPGKLLLATMLQFIYQSLSRFSGSLRGVIAKPLNSWSPGNVYSPTY